PPPYPPSASRSLFRGSPLFLPARLPVPAAAYSGSGGRVRLGGREVLRPWKSPRRALPRRRLFPALFHRPLDSRVPRNRYPTRGRRLSGSPPARQAAPHCLATLLPLLPPSRVRRRH